MMADDEPQTIKETDEAQAASGKQDTEASSAVFELFIGLTGVYSLIIALMMIWLRVFSPQSELLPSLTGINILLSVLFMFDFFRSLWLARKHRLHYLVTWGWVDFLGSLPFPELRLFRVVRIWRAIRRLRAVNLVDDLQEEGADAMLMVTIFVVIILLTFSGIAVFYFERNAPGANITQPDNAFWWSIVTMTTVGYGDYYPITQGGRAVAVVLMGAGLGIIGVLSSYLSQLLVKRARVMQIHRLERLAAKDPPADAKLAVVEKKQAAGPEVSPSASTQAAAHEVAQLQAELASLRSLIEERLPAPGGADE
jgi:hypothetical protein